MKTFSQITMDFATDTNLQQPPSIQNQGDQPVNIGIRLKKLKHPENNGDNSAIQVKENKTKSTRGRKSIKQVAEEADLISIPEDAILFSKQYYTMGEVADMFRVNQSLLRFWEAEF
ncbi:MAG TPA: MerR family transcriptional regulator, partial [Puia sp.]|nr:MerR family transcriptional regulator [Puia sp.]